MKINKLRFQNINSLKGKHIIEFDKPPLSETGIFAITGAVGSGKSTILDVITLALFNKTPRFNDRSGLSTTIISDHGAIITKNTKECYAEIEYQIKNTIYRSKWSLSKTRNDTFRNYEMEITNLTEDKLIDIKKSDIPAKNAKIIGLNYDQFVKSIILSQGEFSKFLKANESERSGLLEKITGVDIYRKVGIACYSRNKNEIQNLELLKAKSESILFFSEEEVSDFNEQLKRYKTENENIQNTKNQNRTLLSTKKNIISFTEEKKQIEIKRNKNKLQQEEFKQQEDSLKRHEKLVIFQNNFNDLQHLENQIDSQKKQASQLDNKLELNNGEKTKIVEKEKNIENKLVLLKDELLEKEPLFEKVENLDKEIKLKTERYKDVKSHFSEKQTIEKQKEKEISEIKNQLSALYIRSEKTNSFLKENDKLKELPKDLNSIKEHSSSFQEYKEEFLLAEKNTKISLTRNKTFKASEVYEKIILETEKVKSTISKIKKETNYSVNDIQLIQDERSTLLEKYKELNEIENSFSKIKEFDFQTIELTKLLKNDKNRKIEVEVELSKYKKEDEIIKAYISELKHKQERQQLEKSYEKGRKELSENENCPLCGSTHHPFIKNYKNELNRTKQQLTEKERELTALTKLSFNAEKEVIKLNSAISTNTNYFNEKKDFSNSEKEHIRNTSEKFNFSLTTAHEATELKTKFKEDGLELRRNLDLLEKLQTLSLQKNNLDLLFVKIKIVFHTEEKINDYREKYVNFIGEGMEAEEIHSSLKKHSDKYETELKNSNKIDNKLIEYENIIKLKNQDLQQLTNEKNNLSEKLNEETEKLNQLKDSRLDLFGEKIPKDELRKINKETLHFSEIANKLTNELTRLNTEISSTQNSLLSLNLELQENGKDKLRIKNNLQEELQKIGFSSIEKAKHSILPNAVALKIKKEENEINNTRIALNQSFTDKTESINQLKTMDNTKISLSELEVQLINNEQKEKQNTKEIGVISNKLATDKLNKKSSAKILQQIEKQQKEVVKWESLTKIIGSATGDKFTKYAQNLTLMQLFSLANKHLRLLDARYLIDQNNMSKEIYILDSYQGNTRRSVKTLSGGESFLVSLALALGLSDLAGRDTQINSLFIDEGFGSLDQQSLDTALSALEKLQNESNKTIGIISHVSSLKERIQTQISLKKSNSAYSEFSIIS